MRLKCLLLKLLENVNVISLVRAGHRGNNRTEGGQSTRCDCTNVELAFLFVIFFLISNGVEKWGEEKKNRRTE